MQRGCLVRIVKTTYTVFDRGVPTQAQTNGLPFGCAYAIPNKPLDDDACEWWVPHSISAEFVRTQLADIDLPSIDLTMHWLVNPPTRYIIGAYLDVLLEDNEPVTITLTYQQPVASDHGFAIPFHGVIALDLLPGGPATRFTGAIDSSGGGSFTVG